MKKLIALFALPFLLFSVSLNQLSADEVTEIDPEEIVFEVPSNIIKNPDHIASGTFFMNFISATLGDEDITDEIVVILNELAGNASTPGRYSVTIAIRDDENEVLASHTFTVDVIKDIYPFFIVDDVWIISNERLMTKADILNTLKALDIVQNEPHAYTELTNTYTENFETPGVYELEFTLMSASGLDYSLSLEVRVLETSQSLSNEDRFNPISFAIEHWQITLAALGVLALAFYLKKK